MDDREHKTCSYPVDVRVHLCYDGDCNGICGKDATHACVNRLGDSIFLCPEHAEKFGSLAFAVLTLDDWWVANTERVLHGNETKEQMAQRLGIGPKRTNARRVSWMEGDTGKFFQSTKVIGIDWASTSEDITVIQKSPSVKRTTEEKLRQFGRAYGLKFKDEPLYFQDELLYYTSTVPLMKFDQFARLRTSFGCDRPELKCHAALRTTDPGRE